MFAEAQSLNHLTLLLDEVNLVLATLEKEMPQVYNYETPQ